MYNAHSWYQNAHLTMAHAHSQSKYDPRPRLPAATTSARYVHPSESAVSIAKALPIHEPARRIAHHLCAAELHQTSDASRDSHPARPDRRPKACSSQRSANEAEPYRSIYVQIAD